MLLLNMQETVSTSLEPWSYGAAVAGDIIFPTRCDYFSACFSFWRGDTKVKFKIYSSPLIRWRMGVLVLPPNVAAPVSFPSGGEYQSYVVEVIGTTEFEMVVPFGYDRWQKVENHETSIARMRVVWYSLMTPSGPGATAPQPYVELWIARGKEFDLARPTCDLMQIYEQAQGELGGEEVLGVETPQGKYAAYTFGESVETLTLLAKKPVLALVTANSISGGSGMDLVIPSDLGGPPLATSFGGTGAIATVIGVDWTFACWLRRAFVGYNGGSCFHVRLQSPTASMVTYEADGSGIGALNLNPTTTAARPFGWGDSGALYLKSALCRADFP